ncbi:heterodisulfide reductase-related iron-sulfur binding cluster [Thermodesulfobacteriota bacterium]
MNPEDKIRGVVDLCADCDICRYLLESTCHLFPELYRLFDRETDTGEKITAEELRHLVDLCNFCAICPCPNIRADIMQAKTAFIDRDGLKLGIRILENVDRIGKICGAYPQLANVLFQNKQAGNLLKKATGIHKSRNIPRFPKENFVKWAHRHQLNRKTKAGQKRKVAFFSGCTGRHFFPEVAKAAVDVFQHNGIDFYYPDQQCCGMPAMLEGDRKLTLKFAESTVAHLAEAVEDGYDIVCSCPTCGYMLKIVLKEGAYYSSEYQGAVGGDEFNLRIPKDDRTTNPNKGSFVLLKKSLYPGILKDEGYFSSISARKRILVAEHTYDLGEYLMELHVAGEIKNTFGPMPEQTVYYPPCHLREQNIGRPYQDLLGLVPELSIETIEEAFYCCGMAGIMGFKREFHPASIKMGSRLMAKIKEIHPKSLITDCLSCRLQFNQLTPYRVFHPIEILKESYAAY